jgi:hypothetical protein
MSVTAPGAASGIPAVTNNQFIIVPVSGTAHGVSPGDLVIWSGQYAIAASGNVAGHKASAIGIALTRSPHIDQAGVQNIQSALLVARYGVFHVRASFSGQPAMGLLAGPVTTGSGMNAPSGNSGIEATWNTATPVSVSGGTGAAPVFGYGQVIAWYNTGPAGTGNMDVVVWDRNADYY